MAKQQKGILGEKLGMTQVWDDQNRLVPVTVVKAGPCVVTQVRTPDKDGYDAVQIAFGAIDPRKVNKPLAGHFAKAGVPPRRHVVEIRTADASTYTIGQEITADIFAPEDGPPLRVDVILIKGAIPGPSGSLVLVRTAAKAPVRKGSVTTR